MNAVLGRHTTYQTDEYQTYAGCPELYCWPVFIVKRVTEMESSDYQINSRINKGRRKHEVGMKSNVCQMQVEVSMQILQNSVADDMVYVIHVQNICIIVLQ